ncbi:MAG: hypothetical protein R2809_00685 [Flavobacteriales bacterium]
MLPPQAAPGPFPVIVSVKAVFTCGPGLIVGVKLVVEPGIVTVGLAVHWNPFVYGIALVVGEGTVYIEAVPAVQLLSLITLPKPAGVV